MILYAILLIAVGLVSALLGLKLFRLLLPIIGLVVGSMVGFTGVQGIFGTGTLSTSMALLVAVVFGLVLAILSFAFFDIAAIVFAAIVGASGLSYLGVALGLREQGFIVFLLGMAGAIIGAIVGAQYAMGVRLVVAITSLLGAAMILIGFMLVAGQVSLETLNNNGIAATITDIVDQSFVWFLVWIGGAIFAMQIQYRLALVELAHNLYAYEETVKNSKS